MTPLRGLGQLVLGLIAVYVLVVGTAGLADQLVSAVEFRHKNGDAFPYEPWLLASIATPYLLGVIGPGVALLALRERIARFLLGTRSELEVELDSSALLVVGLALLGVHLVLGGILGLVYGVSVIADAPEESVAAAFVRELRVGLPVSAARILLGLAVMRWAPAIARRI